MADPPQIPQLTSSPIDALRAGIDRHAAVINAAKAAGAALATTPPPATTGKAG